MARTDRQKLDVLFGEVHKLFYHTIRCGPCLGKSRFNPATAKAELAMRAALSELTLALRAAGWE